MSWQVYVTDQLMNPGMMTSAGIFGVDGNPWAVDGTVCKEAHPLEILRLINIIKGVEQDFNGIRLGGISYLYLSHDAADGSIILNRIKAPTEDQKYVCCGYLSSKCFVFGVVAGNYRLGNCSKVCCRLRDYLKAAGY